MRHSLHSNRWEKRSRCGRTASCAASSLRSAPSKTTSPPSRYPVSTASTMRDRWSGATTMRSIKVKSGWLKSMSSRDSGVENSKTWPFWNSRLKPFLRRSNKRSRMAAAAASASAPDFFLRLLRNRSSRGFHREENIQTRAFTQSQHGLGNLVDGIFLDLTTAIPAIGLTHARIEQAQVVIDLGGRGHGGSRITRGVFLPDGDGRSDAVNQVNIRLLNALQKL